MSPGKMHADEVDTSAALVRRLIAGQFPQWADLPVTPAAMSGTDHAIYRLGGDLSVRLPRLEGAADKSARETTWLPRLAPHLALAIPAPVALGEPAEGYPWPWAVYNWLPGESIATVGMDDPELVAAALAEFIVALRRIDATDGPLPQRNNRGLPLAPRDRAVRASISALGERVDARTALTAWESTLDAPDWDGPPTWFHGDLLPGNLLMHEGRLTAVIDFGTMGVGDPACDVMPAWAVFDRDARTTFRDALDVDDATWERARGWALSVALIALPYYWETNPELAAVARRTIAEVLAEAR